MKKNYLITAYALAVVFICTGVGYKLGYSAKHPPVYIYIKYTTFANKSLIKSLQQAGITVTPAQAEHLGKILKEGEHRVR